MEDRRWIQYKNIHSMENHIEGIGGSHDHPISANGTQMAFYTEPGPEIQFAFHCIVIKMSIRTALKLYDPGCPRT